MWDFGALRILWLIFGIPATISLALSIFISIAIIKQILKPLAMIKNRATLTIITIIYFIITIVILTLSIYLILMGILLPLM